MTSLWPTKSQGNTTVNAGNVKTERNVIDKEGDNERKRDEERKVDEERSGREGDLRKKGAGGGRVRLASAWLVFCFL